MDSVQLTSPRAQFYTRSLKREDAAQCFDRLTWTDERLASEVATELARGAGERKTFAMLAAILEKGRGAIDDHFRPHAAVLAQITSRHGVQKEGAKFYRALLERFPEQASPEMLVTEVLPNEGSLPLVLDQLGRRPEWGRKVADGVLAQSDPTVDALEALGRTADASHRETLAARVLQPGPVSSRWMLEVAALGRAGIEAHRAALLQRVLHSNEDPRHLWARDVMGFKGAEAAYRALLDGDTTERLLSGLEKAGPFASMSLENRNALLMLGSVDLPPEADARLEKLSRSELRGNHGWGPVDGIMERYRSRFQGECLRAIREGEDPVGAAREYLDTVIYRVFPSSLEFQARPGVEQLRSRLGEDAPRVGAELLKEFQSDPSAQDALWLAHSLGTDVRPALEPHLCAPPTGGPLELLTSTARREHVAELMGKLLSAPLDEARGLVERLLPLKPGAEAEVFEAWSECLPEDHWAASYSDDPRERYEAAYCEDSVFRELATRLGDHRATLTAYGEFGRLLEQGIPREVARDRALLGYLVPGSAPPAQQLQVTPNGVQVGSVRLRRKSLRPEP